MSRRTIFCSLPLFLAASLWVSAIPACRRDDAATAPSQRSGQPAPPAARDVHPISLAERRAAPVTRPAARLTTTRPVDPVDPLLAAGARDAPPALTAAASEQFNGSPTDVMLQGFHWTSRRSQNPHWYEVLAQNAPAVKEAGFTLVWFPPPSKTADNEGYLPNRWYELDTAYGTRRASQTAIRALKPDAKAIADIVINHRTGTATADADFTSPHFGPNLNANRQGVVRHDECNCGRGGDDTGDGIHAARDLDHNNGAVQHEIKQWLSFLKNDVGFAGWRYDMVKGYNGKFVADYNDASRPDFSVGEYWDDDRQAVVWWVDATRGKSTAFDFPTRTQLKTAVANRDFGRLKTIDGKPTGVIGWWPAMAVTFLENHDTEVDHFNEVFGNGDQVMQGYAYTLTHPGIPCVFWTHYFDWGSDKRQRIKRLIQIRRQAGLTRTSVPDIRAADTGRYAAIIDNKVAMKIGPGPWDPGPGWNLAADGNDYAVWTR